MTEKIACGSLRRRGRQKHLELPMNSGHRKSTSGARGKTSENTEPNGRRQNGHARNAGNCRAKTPCCKINEKAPRAQHATFAALARNRCAPNTENSRPKTRGARKRLFSGRPPRNPRKWAETALARAPCGQMPLKKHGGGTLGFQQVRPGRRFSQKCAWRSGISRPMPAKPKRGRDF